MSSVSFIYLAIFCNFVAGDSNDYESSKRNDSLILLVDVDTGVDDAMALALAVTSPNVSIEVITVVAGNTNLSNAYNNTLRALRVLNQTKIPVYKGADRPIDGHWDYEEVYFGADNFGNVSSKYPMGNNSAEDPNTYGYVKMMDLIRNRSDCSLTLMMLAPLTNLAIALLVEPTLTEKLKAIYILGGNKCGRGNILPGSEFNFLTDPEAALVVVQRATCPVTIIPWETVLQTTVSWDLYNNITKLNFTLPKFLRETTNHTVETVLKPTGSAGFNLGDFLAMLAAIAPESITKKLQNRVSIELTGTHTRGQLVHAWMPYMLPEVSRNVTVVQAFNRTVVEFYFNKTFNREDPISP